MPLTLSANSTGFTGYASGSAASEQVARSDARISSGLRINQASDDAAGLAAATRLSQQLSSLDVVASRNLGDGISLAQVADGALGQLSENFQRVRELAVQAANGTLQDSDRAALNNEAQQLLEGSRGVLETTQFNGNAVLNSADELRFQTGPDVADQTRVTQTNLAQELDDLGLSEIRLDDQQAAAEAIAALDAAQNLVSDRASEFGALAQGFEARFDQLQVARENTAAARSRVADADLASELSDRAAAQVQQQIATAVRGQANGQQDLVLQLLS